MKKARYNKNRLKNNNKYNRKMPTILIRRINRKLFTQHCQKFNDARLRNLSSEDSIRNQNKIFDNEQKRQRDSVGRIEKIEVRYLGTPKDSTLIMNKNISTPYNCAQHLSEFHCKLSALALIDNKTPWDMHRPIEDSCTIQLLNFKIVDPYIVNRAFWRSCSFFLGAVMQKTFKDEAGLLLHSFPAPNIKSGSFVHDIALNENDWKPSGNDLKTLGIQMIKLASQNLQVERLDVTHDVALEIFKDNPFKREQLPNISNKNKGVVTLYRVGDHIDISKGPMVGSTSFIGKTSIVATHKVSSATDTSHLYRVQGVALPAGFTMSQFVFKILTDRAKNLNSARLPLETTDDVPLTDTPVAQQASG